MKKPKKVNTLPKIKGNLALVRNLKKALIKIIKAMRADIEGKAISILQSNSSSKLDKIDKILQDLGKKWEASFDKLSKELSKQMISKVTKQIDTQFIKINKNYAIKSGIEKLKLTKDVIISENINLIKTIPTGILTKYDTIFKQSILSFDKNSLVNQLKKLGKVNENRAEIIARDQTSKALERYHMSRAEGLGFEYYVWSTSKDERVSKGEGGHRILEGRIYKYNHPTAVIDTNGTIGIPSQRVNCRCMALPLITEPTDRLVLKKDSKNGDYYVFR